MINLKKEHLKINMRRALIIILLLASLLFVGLVHGTTESVSLNVLNSTLSINQILFMNVTVISPNSSNFSIFLNSAKILSENVTANHRTPIEIKYNVGNMQYGTYKVELISSLLSSPMYSNKTLYIEPYANFSFDDTPTLVYVYNNSAILAIHIYDNGNTPLNISWKLPFNANTSISLTNFHQTFQILPSQNETLIINVTTKSPNVTLTFPFSAEFNQTYISKNISISLIKPVINLKFNSSGNIGKTSNSSYYSLSFMNGNDVPINLSFEFLLYINGSPFTYNTWRIIYPGQDKVNISLPLNSVVASVNVMYKGANGQEVKQEVFSAPTSQLNIGSPLNSSELLFIILSIAIILIIIIVYIKLRKKL